MTYQFYNDTESVRVVRNGIAQTIDKDYSLEVSGSYVRIYFNEPRYPVFDVNFTDVTFPSVTSADELRELLEGWKIKDVKDSKLELIQYTQAETFELMLNELTEIKTILKKIYQ